MQLVPDLRRLRDFSWPTFDFASLPLLHAVRFLYFEATNEPLRSHSLKRSALPGRLKPQSHAVPTGSGDRSSEALTLPKPATHREQVCERSGVALCVFRFDAQAQLRSPFDGCVHAASPQTGAAET